MFEMWCGLKKAIEMIRLHYYRIYWSIIAFQLTVQNNNKLMALNFFYCSQITVIIDVKWKKMIRIDNRITFNRLFRGLFLAYGITLIAIKKGRIIIIIIAISFSIHVYNKYTQSNISFGVFVSVCSFVRFHSFYLFVYNTPFN